MAVTRAALVVFLIFTAAIAALVFTLDLSARHSNRQEAATRAVLASSVVASCRFECLALRSSVNTIPAMTAVKITKTTSAARVTAIRP